VVPARMARIRRPRCHRSSSAARTVCMDACASRYSRSSTRCHTHAAGLTARPDE
jgi:hypothetical protein